ncbi:MAG TPA: 50S ribosomal protein L29, partial [Verrucomicrobiae bacterium]
APGGDQAAHPDQVHLAASGFALDGIEFMKFLEMKDMTLVELSAKSRDLRHEMFNLRLQQASAQLEKPARLRVLRRDIARLETRISQLRSRGAELPNKAA